MAYSVANRRVRMVTLPLIDQEVVAVRRVALMVTLIVLGLPGVGAAQADTELEKLPNISIVVEEPDDQAAKCNITASGLDAAVRIPLDASRLGIREPGKSSDGSYLYVNVVVLSQPVGCMAYLDLALKRVVLVGSTGKIEVGSVWDGGRILVGPADGFSARVGTALREHTNTFLGEWIKQNPKPETAPN